MKQLADFSHFHVAPLDARVNKPDNDDPSILDPFEPVEGGSPTLL